MEFSLSPFTEVVPGVYRAVAQPAAVNIGLVVGERGALLIDTGSSPAQGAAIREAAEAVAGLPLTAVVVTHNHFDHFYGLAAFSDLTTYGHASLAPGESVAQEAAELGFDPAELVAPNVPFSLAKAVDLGGRRAELVHFGPGHTRGDVVVIVPDAHVVFAGDLLEQAAPPAFGPDCDLKSWPSAVDGVLGVLGEDWLVVPGHGDVVDRFFAFNQRAEISGVYGMVEHLIDRGVPQERALAEGDWPYDADTITALLPHAYAQLAAAGKRPGRTLPLV